MTSLIRARWTRVKSTPPPPLRLLLLVFGVRRQEERGRISSEFSNGLEGSGAVANRFEIINLDLFRARIARHYLPIITPPSLQWISARTDSARNWMFWRRLASSFGKQPCLTWRWSWPRHNCGWRGSFFFVFRGGGGEKRREIDENCNRQPSRLMEMGSNALDRDKRWGEGEESFGFLPLLFIIVRGKGNFFLTLENKRKRKFSMDGRRDCGVKGL